MENYKKQKNNRNRNSSGFALILALILIPILLVLLTAGLIITDTLYQLRGSGTICRQLTLSTQRKLKTDLMALLALNRPAKKLRVQYIRAKQQLVAATASGNAAAISYAKYYLEMTQISRQALAKKQQFIILKARETLKAGQQIISEKLHSSETNTNHDGLAVTPYPNNDIAPEYKTLEPFREHQAIRVRAKVMWPLKLQLILKTFNLVQARDFQFTCAASLQKRGLTWETVLEKAIF